MCNTSLDLLQRAPPTDDNLFPAEGLVSAETTLISLEKGRHMSHIFSDLTNTPFPMRHSCHYD